MTDNLFCFPQKNQTKEKILKDENTQIFHYFQTFPAGVSLSKISFLGFALVANLLLFH